MPLGMGAGTDAAVGHDAIDFDTMGSSEAPRVEELKQDRSFSSDKISE
jgi:hypothetical protein